MVEGINNEIIDRLTWQFNKYFDARMVELEGMKNLLKAELN